MSFHLGRLPFVGAILVVGRAADLFIYLVHRVACFLSVSCLKRKDPGCILAKLQCFRRKMTIVSHVLHYFFVHDLP